jgi:hypothetical protein
MEGFASGIDLNGTIDRAASFDFAQKQGQIIREIRYPLIIVSDDKRQPIITGEAATLHPAAHNWLFPKGIGNGYSRHRISDVLERLAHAEHTVASTQLASHLRHLAISSGQIGIAVPDDFEAGSQSAVLEAVQTAGRFQLSRGLRNWTPLLVWRSVSAIFGWAQRQSSDRMTQLKGSPTYVISLYSDRLTVSPLEFDIEIFQGRTLATPVRSEQGQVFREEYPPHDYLRDLIEAIRYQDKNNQLKLAIETGNLFARHEERCLFQDERGYWNKPPAQPLTTVEARQRLAKNFRSILEEAFTVPPHFVLIEAPDDVFGVEARSWCKWAEALTKGKYPSAAIEALEGHDTAYGAAEYAARIQLGAPTFYDYLPQIEINAKAEDDDPTFIPLFPKAGRVKGNQTLERRLPDKFYFPSGSSKLHFYLSKEGEQHVRTSTVNLSEPVSEDTPITLIVEQRPVSGHARIEITATKSLDQRANRIVLDWREMEDTSKSKSEIILRLKKESPRSFPNWAPTEGHWAVWKHFDAINILREYCEVEPSTVRKDFRDVVEKVKILLGRRLNPARGHIYDRRTDRQMRMFGSGGEIPETWDVGDKAFARDRAIDAWKQFCEKINRDLVYFSARTRSSDEAAKFIRTLCSASAWAYASAPSEVVEYLRSATVGRVTLGRLIEGIGRTFHSDTDIQSAFTLIQNLLEERKSADRPWAGVNNILRAVISLLQFRKEAPKILTLAQAELIAECAGFVLKTEIESQKAYQQKVLTAVMATLLILRYRVVKQEFLAPPDEGEAPANNFARIQAALELAKRRINNGHQALRALKELEGQPGAIEQALLFLNRSGGNPDIIGVLDALMDDDNDAD